MQTWDDLRFILAVARSGTIADGAKALAVNATTVSRRLRALEAEAGTALFEKLKHGAVLTAAGEEMVTVAEAVEQLVHALDARVHGLDAKLEGTIRVTSTDIFINRWMEDIVAFRSRYPRIELELTSGYSASNLTRREADIAIRIADQAPQHLLGRKHAEVYFSVYGAQKLVEEVGEHASYGAFPWLAWDFSVGRATDQYLKTHVPGARISLRVDRMAPMLSALEAGCGVTILPCFVGDAHPRLRRVGDYFEGGTFLWVLTHPELRGSARVRAFIEFVRGLVARDRAAIEGRLD